MTGRGLTGIHLLPQGQTLTVDYYINNILVACSKRSDSGERCEVKKAMKSRGV